VIGKWCLSDILDRDVISYGLVGVVTPLDASRSILYTPLLYTFYAPAGKAIAYLVAEMAPAPAPARRRRQRAGGIGECPASPGAPDQARALSLRCCTAGHSGPSAAVRRLLRERDRAAAPAARPGAPRVRPAGGHPGRAAHELPLRTRAQAAERSFRAAHPVRRSPAAGTGMGKAKSIHINYMGAPGVRVA
jgi:hypothetical protein